MNEVTYGLLEEAVQTQLTNIGDLDADSKEGKEALTRSIHLVELLLTADRDGMEYTDKEEKRRIEEERNKAMEQIERDKQKITWGRVGLEMSKVVVPLLIQLVAFGSYWRKTLKFEETGRITSSVGREMHFPKFWK